MTSDRLSKADVVGITERLCAVFDKPFGARTETVVTEWHAVLRWLPLSAVTKAVTAWIATKDRMPKPAQIAAMVRESDAGNRPFESAPVVSGCQQCKTDDQMRQVPRRALCTADAIVWMERPLCDCQFRAQVRSWDARFLIDREEPTVYAELERRRIRHAGAA